MLSRLLTLSAAVLALIAAWGATASTRGAWPVWVVAIAVGMAAAARPPAGVMLVAAFAPLGGAIAALAGLRTSATEPLILSVLAGWLLRRTLRPQTWDASAASLAGLLALTICASLAVQCAVAYQVVAPDGLSFPRAVLQWLTQTSEVPSGPWRPEVTAALRLLGGCGLFTMAVEVCRREPSTADASIRLLTLGVASVAALNVNRFLEVVLRQGTAFVPAARQLHAFIRVSSTIPDVNAVGALFALVLPVSVALCLRKAMHGPIWGAVVVVAGAGLWLSGSRAAMAGAGLSVVGYLALVARDHWTRRRTVAVLVLLLSVLTTLVVYYPRAAVHTTSHDAWVIRQQLAKVGFEMAHEAPLFGVGVGRFFKESARFATPELRQYYPAQNAHNQFIQVLGELGTVGAGLFLAVIGCSLIPAWRLAGRPSSPVTIRPLILGLVGFLLASLLMHPLLLAEVSAAFWLALGIARSTVVPAPVDHETRKSRVLVPALVALGLVASLPARITAARNTLDLNGVGVGLSLWRTDPSDDRRYRVARDHAAIYIDARAGRLRVPLRGRGLRAPTIEVTLLLDGHPAGRMPVDAGRWTDLAMLLPPHNSRRPRFRRLDFRWTALAPSSRLDIGQATVGSHAP